MVFKIVYIDDSVIPPLMSVIVKNTLNGQQYVLKFETKLNRPNIVICNYFFKDE